ncbi:MAG: fibronectin type III domain-containing protein [Spirochaetota bacterium]|nr:MAG: fibronectin type III domain-containing protein [Spirochaetota bacterium]
MLYPKKTQGLLNSSSIYSKVTRKRLTLKQTLLLALILTFYAAVICLTFLLMSCSSGAPETGSLTVDIVRSVQPLTLLPDIDMMPTQYSFHGSGPNGNFFDVDVDDPPVFIHSLEAGEWSVMVNAMNTDSIIIGQGQSAATVQAGNTSTINIPVVPVYGHGTMNIIVLWNVADVVTPSVTGQLVMASGAPIELSFTIIEPGRAENITSSIPIGYHSLSIMLLDNGVPVMGAVEVVRIVADQTTSGLFEFYAINHASGDVEINITPEMNDPIQITLSGQEASIAEGGSMTVTAIVPDGLGNATYNWYLNGELKSTGESFTFGSNLPLGVYRLDVTVFSEDTMRAGSTQHIFTVVEAGQVTLMWDPNSETDLAGYMVYYGIASQSYDNVIDVGITETCTVTGLIPGITYYFAATAYNTSALESDYSNEIEYTVSL